jgi:hypothetical protein
MNPYEWKVRASGCHHIMTSLPGLTEKQSETLADLQSRDKLTDNQRKTVEELIAKRDRDELPQGAITHLYDIYDSIMYGIKELTTSKHMDKGNLVEQDSLDLYQRWYAMNVSKHFVGKNHQHYENAYAKGTPDVVMLDLVADVKSSWNRHTWRMASVTPEYYWQLQCYMWLTNTNIGHLAFALNDTPEELIQDEIRRQFYYRGIIDGESDKGIEIEQQIRRNMVFSDRIPWQNRIMVFPVQRNQAHIDMIVQRVEMCRAYLEVIHHNEIAQRYEVAP